MDIKHGTVKAVKEKGYGFIKSESGKDIFFHASRLAGVEFEDLAEGQPVEYLEEEGPKGVMAVDVTVVE